MNNYCKPLVSVIAPYNVRKAAYKSQQSRDLKSSLSSVRYAAKKKFK